MHAAAGRARGRAHAAGEAAPEPRGPRAAAADVGIVAVVAGHEHLALVLVAAARVVLLHQAGVLRQGIPVRGGGVLHDL